jgi:hypothetical protein
MSTNRADPPPTDDDAFVGQVSRHLNELSQFVRRELVHHQAMGDLRPGEVTADEVVDAVVLQVHDEFARDPTARTIERSRLMRLAAEQLDAEIRRA